jgi:EPS-associated MarR family transcriptional regulator
MASRREEQQENARLRVLRLLCDDPTISTRGLADVVGISNGAAYYVLRALVEKGFVKLESFSNNTRKGQYVYLLTPKGIGEKSLLTHRFIKRKRVEFEALRAEIMALEEEIGPKDVKIE